MRRQNNKVSIRKLLTRNVEEIIGREELERRLESGRPLRVKFGIDPTARELHLGNAVVLWKLREFQELGHRVIFVIGDFTAQIGDPSGRLEARGVLRPEEIRRHWRTYQKQAGKIIDWSRAEVRRNSAWYRRMKLEEFFGLLKHFTTKQILERDMFQEREKKNLPIWLSEFLYPLLQGYDSVALHADVEVGGSDQLFNMLRGRDLGALYRQSPQVVLTTPLLLGLDGRKMSKSYENTIGISESPAEQFGKVMSISDELMPQYFALATRLQNPEISNILRAHPAAAKARLAEEIVELYHGRAAARKARDEFRRVFQKKEMPRTLPNRVVSKISQPILDLLVRAKLAPSKSEARRLVEQGAVAIDGEVVKEWQMSVAPVSGMVLKVGKRRFAKLKVQ
ncbi:tyrosine--tRNA ligase [Candidatus Azambacteria bacterium]|nr:tyrosine--tRNA ligase [Candidatus Azambacteria bacterium]